MEQSTSPTMCGKDKMNPVTSIPVGKYSHPWSLFNGADNCQYSELYVDLFCKKCKSTNICISRDSFCLFRCGAISLRAVIPPSDVMMPELVTAIEPLDDFKSLTWLGSGA